MQHASRLFVLGAPDVERFAAVAYMADRIHALRAGRAVVTRPMVVTSPDFAGAAVVIQLEDDGAWLAIAVIGEPEYGAEHQDRLLTGALYRLDPARAA